VSEMFDFDLQRDQLYTQVAHRLQQLIVAESLLPGDKLPGERELASRLGVSRTVVREAIRVLADRGLLRVKQGCGTYVRDLSAKDAAAPLGLLLKMRKCPDTAERLTEVRRTIEVEIAGYAAERKTPEDIAALEEHLALMQAHADDPASYAEHDLAFHLALAKATRNPYYELLIQALGALLSETIHLTLIAPEATQAGTQHHTRLLTAIRQHNADGARQAMRDHLSTTSTLMGKAHKQSLSTDTASSA